jgi:hypothetical protein
MVQKWVPRLIERYCKDGSRLSRDSTYRDGTEMVQRSNSEMVQKCSKYGSKIVQRWFTNVSKMFYRWFFVIPNYSVFRDGTVQKWQRRGLLNGSRILVDK